MVSDIESSDNEDEPTFGKVTLIRREFVDHLAFDLQMDRTTSEAAGHDLSDFAPLPSVRLFDIHIPLQKIVVYPINTLPSMRFLKPKYRHVRSISVDLSSDAPELEDTFDAMAFLKEYLPPGFVKDPSFGLGLIKEVRPIITAIEEIPSVRHLDISDNEETHVDGETFYLSSEDYHDIRLAFQRIARRYQGESLNDRTILAHNSLLNKLLPQNYPEKVRPYEPGTIFKLLGGRGANSVALKGKDRRIVVNAITANAKSIAEHDPNEFIQLQKDIELVSLDKLIAEYNKALKRNRAENEWQKLFELNPFILSMIFGYPIVVVTAGASVGGLTLQGNGTKIADFLVKNSSTHNAAIIEIKRPQTKLFGEEYRAGVWAPSKDVTGAIVQVLDQRQKFLTHIAQIKFASRIRDLEAHAVDCVVVIGRTPTDPNEISSLELVRSQLKDVRLLTFDELSEKLILLREMLSGERYIPPVADDDQVAEDEPNESEQ